MPKPLTGDHNKLWMYTCGGFILIFGKTNSYVKFKNKIKLIKKKKKNCGKFWKRWEYQTTWPASWETYMQVRKQQLELDMKQQTGSK